MFGMRDNPFEKSISRFVFFLEYSVTVTVSTIMCVCEGHVSSRGPYIFAGRTHFVTKPTVLVAASESSRRYTTV
jgi:hypothetical protein